MNKEEYSDLVRRMTPKPKLVNNALIWFISGCVVGALSQTIICFFKKSSELDVAITINCTIFILIAVLLTGFDVFDDCISKCKFGLIIPITGFAHSIASSLMDYRKDGLINGLGSNAFKLAGSVLLYGSISAIVLALFRGIIYG